MNVAIRCDASREIGTGHVMRCLTLADQLHDKGAGVTFICREHVGNINDVIEKHGFSVHRLPFIDTPSDKDFESEYARWLAVSTEKDIQDTLSWLRKQECSVDWLVVDHYGLDDQWEQKLRPFVGRIMVIDDLANRRHDCDLLLDQSFFEDSKDRYDGLVPDTCCMLLGPEYVLLRPEFVRARSCLQERDGLVRRVLVFFGGVDPTNETGKAVRALKALDRNDFTIDVVVGGANPHHEAIRQLCEREPGINYHRSVDNMAQMMARSDLAIGGGGTTTWERCYLGLPTITVLIADNQRMMIEALAARGAVINAGWHADLSIKDLVERLTLTVDQPELLKDMKQAALRVMGDENKPAENPVARAMMESEHAIS